MNPEEKLSTECIIMKCQKKRSSRGLCFSCMATARSYVMNGKATWEFLERNGMVLPKNVPFFSEQFSNLPEKFEGEGNDKWKALGE